MRLRGPLRAFLLCSTFLATPAQAEPISLFVSGLVAGLGGASAIGGAVATALGAAATVGYAVGGALAFLGGSFLGQLALGLGLSALSSLLLPSVGASPDPSDLLVNYAQPMTPWETVYGETRKGGPIAYTAQKNDRRHYTVIVCGHPSAGPLTHYLDERAVTIDGDGFVNQDPPGDLVSIVPFTGSDGASGYLQSTFPGEITAAHDFAGLSGAHLTADRPPPEIAFDAYPTAREPAYLPVWQGHSRIYDPRTRTLGYTNNAALVLAHWITTTLKKEVDWDAVAIEADICGEQVTTSAGTSARYTINGTLVDIESFETQRAKLAVACDAFMYERPDGKVGFYVGRYMTPTVTLTDADILSITVGEGQWGSDAPTEVQVRYIEPDNEWREAPIVWEIESTTRQVRDDIPLYMVNDVNQASRIAKRLATVRRPALTVRMALGLVGYELIGHRFVRLEHQGLGLSTVLEVDRLMRDAGGLSFELEAHSAKPSDWDFDAATEELTPGDFPDLTEDGGVIAPANVAASSPAAGRITVSWDLQSDTLLRQIRVEEDGGAERLIDVPNGYTSWPVFNLAAADHDVQVRNRTAAGRVSVWAPASPITVTVS